MIYIEAILMFLILIFSVDNYKISVIPGHSHNDYENSHLLLDALNSEFISVEAVHAQNKML